jgi:hypothetical protein
MIGNIACQISWVLPMTTLTPADHAALRAMHGAARDPRLKAAIAPYESLRTRGVDHERAVEWATDFVAEGAPTVLRTAAQNTARTPSDFMRA